MIRVFVVVLALVLYGAVPALAGERDRVAVILGSYDLLGDDHGAAAGAEFRFRPWLAKLIPAVGLVIVDKDGTNYLYGGLRYDVRLSERWVFTPQFGVARYSQGDGIDLGGKHQFRSALEFSRRFRSGARVGLLVSHISNAGIHRPNPGLNSAFLTIAF